MEQVVDLLVVDLERRGLDRDGVARVHRVEARANSVATSRGSSPAPLGSDPPVLNSEYVFPDPVMPYANTQPLKPRIAAFNTGSPTLANPLAWSASSPKTPSSSKLFFQPAIMFRWLFNNAPPAPAGVPTRRSSSYQNLSDQGVFATTTTTRGGAQHSLTTTLGE